MTPSIEETFREYPGEKWEYLQLSDEGSMVDTDVLNKWGAQGWQLCMAYVIEQPVVVSIAPVAPGAVPMKRSRVYVYRRPLRRAQ